MRPPFFPSIAMKMLSIGSSLKKSQPLNCAFAVTANRVISLRLRSNQNVRRRCAANRRRQAGLIGGPGPDVAPAHTYSGLWLPPPGGLNLPRQVSVRRNQDRRPDHYWQASPGLWLRLTRSGDAMDSVAPDRMTLRRNQECEAIGMPHTPGYQLNKTWLPHPRPNPRP